MNRHFIRHYLEMIAAMFAGMLVLWMPVEMAFPDVAPAVTFLGMATTMTVPMVAWMRHRGHGWQPSVEMAAAMFIPTLAAIALHGAGALDFHSLMMLEHVAMLLAMLGAMLLRRDEYAGHVHA
jgi:hypothetical protein